MTELTMNNADQILRETMPGCVVNLGIVVKKISKNKAMLLMPVSEGACREGGIFGGQAIASLADTAMCFALWSGERGRQPVATVDLHVTYIRAVKNENLLAQAEVVRSGRTLNFAKVEIVTEQSGKLAGTAVGTFAWIA